MDFSKDEAVLHWPVLLYLALLFVCGLSGNVLVLYIYHWRMKPTIFGFFVQILAFIDLTTVLISLPGSIVFRTLSYDLHTQRMCKFLIFMNHFISLTSGCLFCIIAVQRYRQVCCPHGKQITKSLAAKLISGVLCLTFSLSIPIVFLVGVTDTPVAIGNGTVKIPLCDYEDHLKKNGQSIVYACLVDVEFLGIFVILTCLYSIIGKTMRKRYHGTRTTTKGRFGTKVFGILTILFILCVLPLMIISTIFSFYSEPPLLNRSTKTLFDFGVYLPYLNSIVNPVVYSFNSKLFRIECLSVCPIKRNRNKSIHGSKADTDDTHTVSTSI